MTYITLTQCEDGIVELVFDQPGSSVNTMGMEYDGAMREAVAQLQRDVAAGGIKGVYLRSGKPGQFFAGGDIKQMLEMDLDPPLERKREMFEGTLAAKAPLRTLETLGVPVAVGINGAALGGGFEIALACHFRIALPGVDVGLPEAQIGLMPGAGGVVRTTRLLGMQEAISLISQGARLKAEKAVEKGLLHEIAADEEAMGRRAHEWLLANPASRQPWDSEGYRMPGGGPDHKANQGLLMLGPVNVMNQTKGLMPAQKAIFAAVADTARVDFDTAQKIEARYFLSLLLDQTARNMMTAFFVQMGAIGKGASRPAGVARRKISTLGILGAGQMGAGIAYAAARKGIVAILKDVDLAAAERGKDYARQACARNKRMSEAEAEALLALIRPTADYADLAPCEAVIEAVFERRDIKAAVVREVEAVLGHGALVASNTSALPITELAEASVRPASFIGMHFFSPADKMPLVEIVCGEQTGDETLALAFDLAQQLGKTPIVVNDAPGFFTTRVIGKTVSQGAQMVLEGINPVLVDAAARANGSPVGPLAAIDEISQDTAYRNGLQMKADVEARGETWTDQPAGELVRRMVEEFGRKGRRFGGGYYEYPEGGKKHIWPGLKQHFAPDGFRDIPFRDIQDRLLFSQSLEAVRAMQEGVITSVADGNIGSIMGIGFPAHTGGVFQFINAWGLKAFAARSRELAAAYGTDFEPPRLLLEKAEAGSNFI
jgi:3-hydroxyacyl-CoA dehydrogenase / enoyl-CoA hydratase / 3-hydroxybutyryl-CoA epimerase